MCDHRTKPLKWEEILWVLNHATYCRVVVGGSRSCGINMRYQWREDHCKLCFTLCSEHEGERISWLLQNCRVTLEFEVSDRHWSKIVVVQGRVNRYCNSSCGCGSHGPLEFQVVSECVNGKLIEKCRPKPPCPPPKPPCPPPKPPCPPPKPTLTLVLALTLVQILTLTSPLLRIS